MRPSIHDRGPARKPIGNPSAPPGPSLRDTNGEPVSPVGLSRPGASEGVSKADTPRPLRE